MTVHDGSSLILTGDTVVTGYGLIMWGGHVEISGNASLFYATAPIDQRGGDLLINTSGYIATWHVTNGVISVETGVTPILARGKFAAPGDALLGLETFVTGNQLPQRSEVVKVPKCTEDGTITYEDVTLNVVEVTAK